MTQAFKQGFLDKLAEFDKQAKSTAGNELAGSLLWGVLPYANLPHAIGATLGALNARDLSDEELEKLIATRENAMNYVPGVAGYRMAQRTGATANAMRERAKELGISHIRPTRHTATEALGSLINPLNLIGNPIGLIAGAAGKHRTLDEQIEHDSKGQSLKNILIPGYAAYHSAKRLGATRDVMEKDDVRQLAKLLADAGYDVKKKKKDGEEEGKDA